MNDHGRNEISNGAYQFCSENSISSAVICLTRELDLLGLCTSKEQEKPDFVAMLNGAWKLLHTYRNALRCQEELENRLRRNIADLTNLRSNLEKVKDDLKSAEQAVVEEKERGRELGVKCKHLQQDLKRETEEIRRLKSVTQQMDVQYKHDLRKKDKEMNRLRERLNQVMEQHDRSLRRSFEVSSSIPRPGNRRGKWVTTSTLVQEEKSMFNHVLKKCDNKQQELLQENNCLRDTITSIHNELGNVTLQYVQLAKNGHSVGGDIQQLTEIEQRILSIQLVPQSLFEMSFDMVKKTVEETCHNYCSLLVTLKRFLYLGPSQAPKPPVEDKQNKIVDKGMNTSMVSDDGGNISFLMGCQFLEENEKFENDRKILEEQKLKLKEQQKILVDAAVKLADERQKFEEQKLEFLRSSFHSFLPEKIDREEDKMNLCLPRACFTPVSSQKIRPFFRQSVKEECSPSSLDLLNELKLSPESKVFKQRFVRSASNLETSPKSKLHTRSCVGSPVPKDRNRLRFHKISSPTFGGSFRTVCSSSEQICDNIASEVPN